jgi:hypothetical protein
MTHVYILTWGSPQFTPTAYWTPQDAKDAAEREVGEPLTWRQSPDDAAVIYTQQPPYCSVMRLQVQP